MTNQNSELLGSAKAEKDHQKVVPVVIQCACNRDLTLEELAGVYPETKKSTIQKFHDGLNVAMKHYDIHSCLRKAHFLAQVGHESSELKFTAEILAKGVTEENAYGGYKGRGLIQITGIDNYSSYGTYIGQDLLGSNKYKIEEPKLASDSAGWFWKIGRGEDLNLAADRNDMLYITVSINGAFNGYEGTITSRLKLLRNAVNALHVKACAQLEALFSAFPEAEKFTYESFPFEKSKTYEIPDTAFAWGYWHDPKSGKHGTKKDINQAKLGYARYLELIKQLPSKKKRRGRFGFKSRDEMKFHAETRLR